MDMAGWELITPIDKSGNFTNLSTYPVENATAITVSLIANDTFENIIYFSAPDTYLDLDSFLKSLPTFDAFGGPIAC